MNLQEIIKNLNLSELDPTNTNTQPSPMGLTCHPKITGK